jgi:hypothetical protein
MLCNTLCQNMINPFWQSVDLLSMFSISNAILMIYNNHNFILSFVQTSHQFSCLIHWFRYFERCVCCQGHGDIIQLIYNDKTYLFRGKIILSIVVNIILISQLIYIFCTADRQKSVPKNAVSRRCFTCLSVWKFSPENTFSGDVPLYAKFEVPIAVTTKSAYYLLRCHTVKSERSLPTFRRNVLSPS